MTGTYLNSTFSNNLLIDSWCSIFKSINRISDDFKFLSGSLISTDKAHCVAKLGFASQIFQLKMFTLSRETL